MRIQRRLLQIWDSLLCDTRGLHRRESPDPFTSVVGDDHSESDTVERAEYHHNSHIAELATSENTVSSQGSSSLYFHPGAQVQALYRDRFPELHATIASIQQDVNNEAESIARPDAFSSQATTFRNPSLSTTQASDELVFELEQELHIQESTLKDYPSSTIAVKSQLILASSSPNPERESSMSLGAERFAEHMSQAFERLSPEAAWLEEQTYQAFDLILSSTMNETAS